MRFLVDECLLAEIVNELRLDGHDVHWVADDLQSVEDAVLLEIANAERRILMSDDRDFGELVFKCAMPDIGIVSLRVAKFKMDAGRIGAYAADKVAELGPLLLGQFALIEPGGVWLRSLPRSLA
ncbi:MAG TPA: DUF5615 family PIN-like protein [Hyphomicrobiaceae bacterium]|nr:DUF5615 family PIN-like protein [Hyphomicrobiaceae bacterium]